MPFLRNKRYELHRGFAYKDRDRNWRTPDGTRIISEKQADGINARRRAQLTVSDAWADLKNINPEKAKELGYRGFQKITKGVRGSRFKLLERLSETGSIDLTTNEFETLSERAEDPLKPWGDSP